MAMQVVLGGSNNAGDEDADADQEHNEDGAGVGLGPPVVPVPVPHRDTRATTNAPVQAHVKYNTERGPALPPARPLGRL
jgi:hypothetical protein